MDLPEQETLELIRELAKSYDTSGDQTLWRVGQDILNILNSEQVVYKYLCPECGCDENHYEAIERVKELSVKWQNQDPGYGFEYDKTKLLSYYHAAHELREALKDPNER